MGKEDLNVGTVFQHLAENYVNQVKSYDVIDSSFPSFQIGSQRPAIIYQNGYNKHDKRNKSIQQWKENSLKKRFGSSCAFMASKLSSFLAVMQGKRKILSHHLLWLDPM